MVNLRQINIFFLGQYSFENYNKPRSNYFKLVNLFEFLLSNTFKFNNLCGSYTSCKQF